MSWLKIINIHRNHQSTHSHVCVVLTFQITWLTLLWVSFVENGRAPYDFHTFQWLWESRGDTIQIANLPEMCIFMQIKPICRQLIMWYGWAASKLSQMSQWQTLSQHPIQTRADDDTRFIKIPIHKHTHTHVGFIDAAVSISVERKKNSAKDFFGICSSC